MQRSIAVISGHLPGEFYRESLWKTYLGDIIAESILGIDCKSSTYQPGYEQEVFLQNIAWRRTKVQQRVTIDPWIHVAGTLIVWIRSPSTNREPYAEVCDRNFSFVIFFIVFVNSPGHRVPVSRTCSATRVYQT